MRRLQTCAEKHARELRRDDTSSLLKAMYMTIVLTKPSIPFSLKPNVGSQRKPTKPHQLWFAVSGEQPYNVITAYCSCVAGASGFCNLFQTSHFFKRKLDVVQPDGSKTSITQTWDKPRVHGQNLSWPTL